MGSDELLRSQHLVETDWLESHLNDPAIRVVDMRGNVRIQALDDGSQKASYEGAREEYEAGHIPGAVYIDWTSDIVDLDDPVPVQVAPPDKFARAMGAAGIGSQTLVVAYDNHPAMQFATRLWWALKHYGHESIRVLNGGWSKWLRERRATRSGMETAPHTTFVPNVRPDMRISAEGVASVIGDSSVRIVDARDAGQYSGKIRRGPRGGHIPGAIHIPRESLVAEDGSFRNPEELRKVVESAGVDQDSKVIAYCNGGVAATSVIFSLSMLGYLKLANYDGSWNEWSHRLELLVETDKESGTTRSG